MKIRILLTALVCSYSIGINAQTQDCPDSCNYYVPNTLTPDCDQAGCEILEIVTNCSFNEFEFKLFNRWGEIIFESTDPEKKFDSTDHKDGTYFWILKGSFCNKRDLTGNGHLQIIR